MRVRTHRGTLGAFGRVRFVLAAVVAAAGIAANAYRLPDRPGAPLGYAAAGLAAAALLAGRVLRVLAARSRGDLARTFTVAAWALATGAALFGCAVHYMGMPLFWAIPGSAAFLAAILLVPVPEH